MKLLDLYNRVLETTGLEVMTLGSLNAAIKNCMADLTSRGYKNFKEIDLLDVYKTAKLYDNYTLKYLSEYKMIKSIDTNHRDIFIINAPHDIRKTLYLKVFFKDNAIKATRYTLTNPKVQCTLEDGYYKSVLNSKECIYYLKNDKIYIEWDESLGELYNFMFGYYARIEAPNIPSDMEISEEELIKYDIPIRSEFEDALVFYACYFYYARYMKDQEKLQFYINQYKYYVEDITHEISYEDDYNEEELIIHTDDY